MTYPGFATRVAGPVPLAEQEAYPSGVPELTLGLLGFLLELYFSV